MSAGPSIDSSSESAFAVKLFIQRFGESYRPLLDYAALPLVLTPELLNYIHSQFLREKRVPWQAQADLLLSNLCRQIGYEQYALDLGVRTYLLDELQRRGNQRPIQQVARLLLRYIQHQWQKSSWIDRQDLQVQRWSAMAFLADQRSTLSQELKAAFEQAVRPDQLATVAQITHELGAQLKADHPTLVVYADLVSRLLDEPDGVYPPRSDGPTVAGLPPAAELVERVQDELSDVELVHRGMNVFANLLGTTAHQDTQLRTTVQLLDKQLQALHTLLELFDLLYTLEIECYDGLSYVVRSHRSARLDQEQLDDYAHSLQTITAQIQHEVSKVAPLIAPEYWLPGLQQAQQLLQTASAQSDLHAYESTKTIRNALEALDEVIAIQPTRVNELSGQLVRALPIDTLVQQMQTILDAELQPNPLLPDRVNSGGAALERLYQMLQTLAATCIRWQQVEQELRRLGPNPDENLVDLHSVWRVIQRLLIDLIQDQEHSGMEVFHSATFELGQALAKGSKRATREAFGAYRDQISYQLYQTSLQMRRTCEDIAQGFVPLLKIWE